MAYCYTVGIKARGKAYRTATVTAKNDSELKRACNTLLEHDTEVTIIKKSKV